MASFQMTAEVAVLALIWLTGVAIAVAQILHSRKLARQKATLAFMRDYTSAKRADDGFTALRSGKPWNELSPGEKADIHYLFNMFEGLGIGLREGIYDAEMTRSYFGDEISNIYYIGGAKQIIYAIRAEDKERHAGSRKLHQEAYYHLEKLAEEMK